MGPSADGQEHRHQSGRCEWRHEDRQERERGAGPLVASEGALTGSQVLGGFYHVQSNSHCAHRAHQHH